MTDQVMDLKSDLKPIQFCSSPDTESLLKYFDSHTLADSLEEYYEEKVQQNLDHKLICEGLAYSVAYKVLRKVQTVDERFRAKSLVSLGISYDGSKTNQPIYLEMINQLYIGYHNTVMIKRDQDGMFAKPQLMSCNGWKDCLTISGFISASKVLHTLRRHTKKAVHVLRKYISQGKQEKLPDGLKSLYIEDGPTVTLVVNDSMRVQIIPALAIPDCKTDISSQDCPSSSHILSVPNIPSCTGTYQFIDGSQTQKTKIHRCDIMWKFSFFAAEKSKMRSLKGGCRVQLLRLLTDIRDENETLKQLSSYHLKNILFHECDYIPDLNKWKQSELANRFIGLLNRLKKYLSEEKCPHYFLSPPEYPEVNLFERMDKVEIKKMLYCIEILFDKIVQKKAQDMIVY